MPADLRKIYGDRVRVRACGLCVKEGHLLMVNHRHLTKGDFWAPPGGGIEFGESAEATMVREIKEETYIQVHPEELLFVAEYINDPLHAVELFFKATYVSGEVKTGVDPETSAADQIIIESQFWSWDALQAMDKNQLHGIFKFVRKPSEILDLRGYFKL